MTAPIIVAEELVKRYRVRRAPWDESGLVRAVERVSFALAPGETLGIVGESGAGKSTVGRCILGLERPTSGTLSLFGKNAASASRGEWRQIRRDLQAVFQDPVGALNPRWPIRKIVGEPLRRLTDLPPNDIDDRARLALESVGLARDLVDRRRHQLSGGQQQRVSIARALSVSPRCIVLDEPVAALDASVKRDVIVLLQQFKAQHELSYVLISHDLRVVRALCDRVLILFHGRVVEVGPTTSVTAQPQHPYTQELLSAQLFLPGDPGAEQVKGLSPAADHAQWSSGEVESGLMIGDLEAVAPGHYVASDRV
jgi:ABC-type glutathione transport system ATPase component